MSERSGFIIDLDIPKILEDRGRPNLILKDRGRPNLILEDRGRPNLILETGVDLILY